MSDKVVNENGEMLWFFLGWYKDQWICHKFVDNIFNLNLRQKLQENKI